MKCLYETCERPVKEVEARFERQRKKKRGRGYRTTSDGRVWRDYCSPKCSGRATGEAHGSKNGGSNEGTIRLAKESRQRRFNLVLKRCKTLTEDGRVDSKDLMRATLDYGREEYQRGWKAGYKRGRKDEGYGMEGAR